MFKNKTGSGRNNIAGSNIAQLRKSATPKMSQRLLADKVQLEGLNLDKNAIQRIESGQRFVTDIELKVFARIFQVSYEDLLSEHKKQTNA